MFDIACVLHVLHVYCICVLCTDSTVGYGDSVKNNFSFLLALPFIQYVHIVQTNSFEWLADDPGHVTWRGSFFRSEL